MTGRDTAVVLSNGRISDYSYYGKYFAMAGFIVCADAGAAHARKFGIVPDLLVGDFDSLQDEDLRYFKNLGVPEVRFSVEKDMTDTELALNTVIDRGYRTIFFIGGIGTRLDHTLANVLLLKKLLVEKGVRGFIVDEYNEITLIDRSIELDEEKGVRVSLLPVSESVTGINTEGLYYPLHGATLKQGTTLGISNEFAGGPAKISIGSGYLLVIKARD